MPVDDVHRRRAGEYNRPGERLILPERFPNPDDYYRRYPRGTVYNCPLFDGLSSGETIDLELVPELFNWHDAEAVAIDYRAGRIGYMPAADASKWHDIVRAANRRGYSVWIRGVLEVADLDGQPWLVPVMSLPRAHRLDELAEELGFTAVVRRLLDRVGDHIRSEILEGAWDGLPDGALEPLRKHAHEFPELTWPTDPPAGIPPRTVGPGALYAVLRGLILLQRRAASEERRRANEERRTVRLAEEAEKARVRSEEMQRRERERNEQLVKIRARVAEGWTTRAIADDLAITRSAVEKLRREANLQGPATYNEQTRASRLERCTRALALQRAGLSRAAIGEELASSPEAVKSLLRDAKFYEAPENDDARLSLARAASAARRNGMTKSAFQTAFALSPAKALEAWRDADVIALDAAWAKQF